MAQSKSLADNLEKHLECPICLEQYKEPKVLPCLHTFCGACLEGLLTKQEAIWKVACPTCRTNAEIADGKIDSLPVNFFVNNLLSVLSLHGSSDAGVLECDNCEGGDPPTSRCTVCSYFLCEFCSQGHQRARMTKSHRLMSLQEAKEMGVSAVMKPSFCKDHDGEVLKLFCETCDQVICRDCTIINHRDHDYLFLKDAFIKGKGEVQHVLQETKNKVPILEQALNGISQSKQRIKFHAEQVEKSVNDCFEELMSALEIRRLDLTRTAEDLYKSKVKGLEIQQQDLEIALGSVKSSIEFAEKAFESGNQIDALNLKKQITSRLQALSLAQWQLEPCVIDAFEFQSDHGELQREITTFGAVMDTAACPSTTTECQIDHGELKWEMATCGPSTTTEFQSDHGELEWEIATFGAVMDTAVCPSTTTVTMGHGPEGVMYDCLNGQPLEFTILARNRFGQDLRNGGDVFFVKITELDVKPSTVRSRKRDPRFPQRIPGQDLEVITSDCGNGTYTFAFTPQKAGNYHLIVQLDGHNVKGSPFRWNVQSWFLENTVSSSRVVSMSVDSLSAVFPQPGPAAWLPVFSSPEFSGRFGQNPYQRGFKIKQISEQVIFGSEGFQVGNHSWKVRLSFDNPCLAVGVTSAGLPRDVRRGISQFKNYWTLNADGKYNSPSVERQSLITERAKNDVIEMYLDCDKKVLFMYNQRTKQCDAWSNVRADRWIYPVFILNQSGDEVSLNL